MNSSNPHLVGLWCANHPGWGWLSPRACAGCQEVIPQGKASYRLFREPRPGVRPVGYLCKFCRKGLGPLRLSPRDAGRLATQIERREP